MIEFALCLALSKELIFSKIEQTAKDFNVSESMMSYVVMNEAAKTKSGDFLPCGIGDTHLIDPDGNRHRSRGIVQINEFYNPHISDEMAFSPMFSLEFLASNLRPYTDRKGNYKPYGNCSMWTTCRAYLKKYMPLTKK